MEQIMREATMIFCQGKNTAQDSFAIVGLVGRLCPWKHKGVAHA